MYATWWVIVQPRFNPELCNLTVRWSKYTAGSAYIFFSSGNRSVRVCFEVLVAYRCLINSVVGAPVGSKDGGLLCLCIP